MKVSDEKSILLTGKERPDFSRKFNQSSDRAV